MQQNAKNMEKLEKRMYFLVLYNISPIQQAIQAGHAQNEYALKYWKDKEFQDWAKRCKTWIILNGGTSNDGLQSFSSILSTQFKTGISCRQKYAAFRSHD